MTKKRKTSLTLAKVDKMYNNMSKWSEYILDKEENVVIKYKEFFDEKEVEKLMIEAQKNSNYLKENGLELFSEGPEGDSEFLKYIYLLMIKYFTDFGQKMSDNIVDQMKALDRLESTGLFRLIFEEVFEPEEVLKVVDRIYEKVDLMANLERTIGRMQKELEEKVQNKNVLSMYDKKEVLHPLVDPEGRQ